MGIVLHGGPHDSSVARAWPTDTCLWGPRPLLLVGKQAAGTRVASSPDSDLEAFSHNPAHGSFAPLAFQPSAMTNCANQRSKGSLGHAFTVRIRTGNQNQTSFYPSVPHEISVLVELILGHLRYLLTDVPPQPNSPPDNVFRPDRPAEAGLGSKKRGICPASDSRNKPRRSRSQSVPRPARGDPLLAAEAARAVRRQPTGSGLGPPCPALRANPFPEVTDPFLPTSLAYIVPSTRGCSPWRPDAVMSTTGAWGGTRSSGFFKGRRGRTGHRATCGALPAAGPYLRLSHPHRRPLRPGSRPRFLQRPPRPPTHRGLALDPDGPGVGRALKRHPFSGLVDSAGELLLHSLADFDFHDHRPAVLSTNTLCGF
ncbi:hypothetical protein L1887_50091 [Cichorium endivia]|nr:hypothetical protein L1887_50091 [Cichorium endivia]